jgi:hypothetical protein
LPDVCPRTSPGMACSALTGRHRATLNTTSPLTLWKGLPKAASP